MSLSFYFLIFLFWIATSGEEGKMASNFQIGPPHTGSVPECADMRQDILDAKLQPTCIFMSCHMSISSTMMSIFVIQPQM